MSNVAFHSFPDALLRSILGEVARVLRAGGYFLFHVNSLEDMQYRPKVRIEELEPDFYLESDGQTMHFFSDQYCRDLLQGWQILDLTHVHLYPICMSPVKCVNRTWLSTGCAPCIRRGPEPPEAAQQYRRSAQRNQPAARTAGGISATSLRVSFASDSALK